MLKQNVTIYGGCHGDGLLYTEDVMPHVDDAASLQSHVARIQLNFASSCSIGRTWMALKLGDVELLKLAATV